MPQISRSTCAQYVPDELPRVDGLPYVCNQSRLRSRVAVDVVLGGFDRTMPGEQLDVAQAEPGAVDVAGSDRDEVARRRGRILDELKLRRLRRNPGAVSGQCPVR